jgi:hypothetical protein
MNRRRRWYRKCNRQRLEVPQGVYFGGRKPRDESHSRTVETRVSAWQAFRNRSSRATPAGMPSACLRKFCESLMSRSSREGVCGMRRRCCMAQLHSKRAGARLAFSSPTMPQDLPMIFGSRFPRQPGVHTNRMGELIGTGPGFVFRDRPHSRARPPNPHQQAP